MSVECSRTVVAALSLVSVQCSSPFWTHFTRTIGTDLETIWHSVESSYSGVGAQIHCPHYGAVTVAA